MPCDLFNMEVIFKPMPARCRQNGRTADVDSKSWPMWNLITNLKGQSRSTFLCFDDGLIFKTFELENAPV